MHIYLKTTRSSSNYSIYIDMSTKANLVVLVVLKLLIGSISIFVIITGCNTETVYQVYGYKTLQGFVKNQLQPTKELV